MYWCFLFIHHIYVRHSMSTRWIDVTHIHAEILRLPNWLSDILKTQVVLCKQLSIKIILKDKIAITKYVLQASIILGNRCGYNGPFYSCLLGCLSLEWKWGWRWPCFDINLPLSYVNVVLMLISINLRNKGSEVSIKSRSTPA